jgi:hypothetical protein
MAGLADPLEDLPTGVALDQGGLAEAPGTLQEVACDIRQLLGIPHRGGIAEPLQAEPPCRPAELVGMASTPLPPPFTAITPKVSHSWGTMRVALTSPPPWFSAHR